MKDPRYPIGRFQTPEAYTPELRERLIQEIEDMPVRLEEAVAGLTGDELGRPYREGGWTIRQVVHHLADANMNAYIRFKLARTEDNPRVKPFAEAEWAELEDAAHLDISVSLALVSALNQRWATFLRSMDPESFSRTYDHPEDGKTSLDKALAFYSWHGRHHIAQITTWRENRKNAS